jgi:hypothetical protein
MKGEAVFNSAVNWSRDIFSDSKTNKLVLANHNGVVLAKKVCIVGSLNNHLPCSFFSILEKKRFSMPTLSLRILKLKPENTSEKRFELCPNLTGLLIRFLPYWRSHSEPAFRRSIDSAIVLC